MSKRWNYDPINTCMYQMFLQSHSLRYHANIYWPYSQVNVLGFILRLQSTDPQATTIGWPIFTQKHKNSRKFMVGGAYLKGL